MTQLTRVLLVLTLMISTAQIATQISFAAYDPVSQQNNKFGMHILSPDELPVAAHLVNANGGDWGYLVIVIQSNDRDTKKWQQFMNQARNYHIIPILRIATTTKEDYWQKPEPTDAAAWADFFSKLYWPTHNHYVVLYNEPNHAKEWGNSLDPAGFAQEIVKTINEVKSKDPNIFVLNPGFDAASPSAPDYMDEVEFMQKMDQAVPGIFQKFDGWASHSYPQPNYSGDPLMTGRNSILTYRWEEQILLTQFHREHIPIFITETGWTQNTLSEDKVAEYYKIAYSKIWNDANLVAITPFTLSYQTAPFQQFSWLRKPVDQVANVLGVSTDTSVFTKQFAEVEQMKKIAGKPVQIPLATIVAMDLPIVATSNSIVTSSITLKNIGESRWFEDGSKLQLSLTENGQYRLEALSSPTVVDPGSTYTIHLDMIAPSQSGTYQGVMAVNANTSPIITLPFHVSVNTPKAQTLQSTIASIWYKVTHSFSS